MESDVLNKAVGTIASINNLILDTIKPLPDSIIHSNPIYTCQVKNKPGKVYLKIYKSDEILKREEGCNDYLKHQGILVQEIISSGFESVPYTIAKEIIGKPLTSVDIKMRINDLAKIHVNSLINGTKELKFFLFEKTKPERLFNLKLYQQVIQKYLTTTDEENIMMEKLRFMLSEKEPAFWHNCFCFNDFFINNSLVSPRGIYYYDFEKTCIRSPFLDVGCVVLNFMESREEVKSSYIKGIKQLMSRKKEFFVEELFLNHMIDLGTCEKALEDAAFLADDSIKKTRDSAYCRKLATDVLYKFTSIFRLID